jgi:lipopolysaccharide/colanic/teichoic acid biosynthesis glycosyltransferase
MLNTYDDKGNLLPDEERTTKFGEFLRSTSLDELPELINVIKGEMSIVGPRPLIMAYLPLYNKEQARRHDVKPGITGLAQVGGRNALSWDQRFDLDIEYVDTHNLLLDISIILKTIKTVFKREGIGHADLAALSEFKGDALAQTDKQNI